MTHVPYKLHAKTALARAAGVTGWVKGAPRKYFNIVFGNPAKKRLESALAKLSLYCQAPVPKAGNATDLHSAMKLWTWWPQQDLLKQIKDTVMTLVKTERKDPERQRPWEMFELVDKRNLKLHLVERINDLVGRARDRFLEANFSDLEALSWEQDDIAKDLLRDIDGIRQGVNAAKAIDWARYESTLSKVSGNGRLTHVGGGDTALACYARALELIVDHRRWAKLRKDSESLVYWLLGIDYPGVNGRDGLEQFNRAASFRWLEEKARRVQQKLESKLEEYRHAGIQIEWDEKSREDARSMGLIANGDLKALEALKQRYWRMVAGIATRIMGNNQDADEIALAVFGKVWAAAAEYIPTPFFKTWLSKIAVRTAIDELRRRRKANLVDSDDWSWQPPEQ